MRRGFVVFASLVALSVFGRGAVAQTTAPDPFPLTRVALFSSGVGYFEHAGPASAARGIQLALRTDAIDDILKSLVIIDPEHNVQPVTYATADSLQRRLAEAGLSLGADLSRGGLLRQFQGQPVRVGIGAEVVEGRIVSVSHETEQTTSAPQGQTNGPPQMDSTSIRLPLIVPSSVEVLNLATEAGLRSIELNRIADIQLTDTAANERLQELIRLMAKVADRREQTVTLHFGGANERMVRAGYLNSAPVWKTSYRLVLDAKARPFLQGWGIVENTSNQNWNSVALSLVSGRPISFVENLSEPFYVTRPTVQPQVTGAPAPQIFLPEGVDSLTALDPQNSLLNYADGAGGAVAARKSAPQGLNGPPGPQSAPVARYRAATANYDRDLSQSARALAQGGERGELFTYDIEGPVSIERGQAAMVPIVSSNVDGDRVSIYDAAVPGQALNGVRLKNTSGLDLSGGPITVFQDGSYAGDAEISNVRPGESRLISYAVDLDVVANQKSPESAVETMSFTAHGGVLTITRKYRYTHAFTFHNKSASAKTVLVLQPIEAGYVLKEPEKPSEATASEDRFEVPLKGNADATFKIVTERVASEVSGLADIDLDTIVTYTKGEALSPAMQQGLEQIVTRRRKILDLQQQQSNADDEIKAISADQGRMRGNMQQLDRASALYLVYVKKMTEQESRIGQLRDSTVSLKNAETAAQNELAAYLQALNVS